MKKKSASNPLKFFNDNKAKAYKKGGIAMKSFKKSLPKAQDGKIVPPGTVMTDERIWTGKKYSKAPVKSTDVPPGTVMNDGRIWDGKRYVDVKKGGAIKSKKK
jgi:hypothetical protein